MKKKITQHNSVHFNYNHAVDFCFHMIAGYSLCDSFVSDASQVRSVKCVVKELCPWNIFLFQSIGTRCVYISVLINTPIFLRGTFYILSKSSRLSSIIMTIYKKKSTEYMLLKNYNISQ